MNDTQKQAKFLGFSAFFYRVSEDVDNKTRDMVYIAVIIIYFEW